MLAAVSSATLVGVDGRPVRVEVHVSTGLPGFTVVGLPDTTCREARDRVRAALLSSDLRWPTRKITINLAPSGVRKMGAGLDLAMASGCTWPGPGLRPGALRPTPSCGPGNSNPAPRSTTRPVGCWRTHCAPAA